MSPSWETGTTETPVQGMHSRILFNKVTLKIKNGWVNMAISEVTDLFRIWTSGFQMVQLENTLIIPLYFTRCLLPCVWVHGPWLNGAARIWLGTFLRGPYQVFHETVNGRSGLLSQKEFPSSRYQVLQHLTEQQVTWQSTRFFASSFPCILPGFSWKHSVVVFTLSKLRIGGVEPL